MESGSKSIIIFGYGKFGRNITQSLKKDNLEDILLIESNRENYNRALQDGFTNVKLMDVTDDHQLEKIHADDNVSFVCVMDDDHLNVFIVLSLKAIYPNNRILAISDSIHATSKLKMAGADKVIDLYAISANRIHNILNKPIATRFLEGFADKSHDLAFRELHIPEGSFLHGRKLEEIDFYRYGVIFLGMIDTELGNSFIFVTSGVEHKLDSGDIIVCIGHEDDLKRFEKLITEEREEYPI